MSKYIVVLLLLLTAFTAAQEIIPINEVKQGMTGYGISVFKGHRLERFQVEVIDIFKGFLPGEDIILIRCRSMFGSFDIERSGLIAGMSGSPIYLGGKLAGALAYGWPDARETLAGVTAIESMLKISKRPVEKMAGGQPTRNYYPSVGGLVPLQTPLVVNGVTRNAFGRFNKFFADSGLMAIHGCGAPAKGIGQKVPAKLVPGSAIGAQLMSGDMDVTAVGTVTWVKDQEVLAFGHPFFNAGQIEIPITSAYIATVMESKRMSFKLGFPVEPIGTLCQDRLSGIYGQMGKKCPMIPVQITVRNKNTNAQRIFNIEVINHSFFTSRLCQIAIFSFLDAQEGLWGENTCWFRSRVFLQDRKDPVEWANMHANKVFIMGEFFNPLRFLYQNPFARPAIKKMEVELEVGRTLQQADITSVEVTPSEVNPGDTLRLHIKMRPQYRPEESVILELAIPKDLPEDDYALMIVGGGNFKLPFFEPESNDQFLRTIKKSNKYKSNYLVATLLLPELKVFYHGKQLSDLPPSVVGNMLATNRSQEIQMLPKMRTVVKETPYIISGAAQLLIKVKVEDHTSKGEK